MRTLARAATRWGAAVFLLAGGASGCSSHSVAGEGTTNSSSAFSVFAQPQRPIDEPPASLWTPVDTTPTVPDVHTSRRIATSETLAVYLIHTDADFLCVVIQELPGKGSGSEGCSPGTAVIDRGMVQGWETGTTDPTSDHTAVLVPDGYTATITKGTFELAGQGVLVARGDGVDIALTNSAGHTLHLSTPNRSQR